MASLSSLASLLSLPSPIIVIVVVVLFALVSVGLPFGVMNCGEYHNLPGHNKYTKRDV